MNLLFFLNYLIMQLITIVHILVLRSRDTTIRLKMNLITIFYIWVLWSRDASIHLKMNLITIFYIWVLWSRDTTALPVSVSCPHPLTTKSPFWYRFFSHPYMWYKRATGSILTKVIYFYFGNTLKVKENIWNFVFT